MDDDLAVRVSGLQEIGRLDCDLPGIPMRPNRAVDADLIARALRHRLPLETNATSTARPWSVGARPSDCSPACAAWASDGEVDVAAVGDFRFSDSVNAKRINEKE